tara:strand:+ start:456 stop:590 length:135 start_codon:yes stop_codon:yes gene_type:complete
VFGVLLKLVSTLWIGWRITAQEVLDTGAEGVNSPENKRVGGLME